MDERLKETVRTVQAYKAPKKPKVDIDAKEVAKRLLDYRERRVDLKR